MLALTTHPPDGVVVGVNHDDLVVLVGGILQTCRQHIVRAPFIDQPQLQLWQQSAVLSATPNLCPKLRLQTMPAHILCTAAFEGSKSQASDLKLPLQC